MKRIIITGLVFIANLCIAQDSEYLKLWNKYYDECSKIVSDTLIENGTVNYYVNPDEGEVKLIPIDTTWKIEMCREYKEENFEWQDINNEGILVPNMPNEVPNEVPKEFYMEDSNHEIFSKTIRREKICTLKLRKPTQEGFWNWLKDNGYRK